MAGIATQHLMHQHNAMLKYALDDLFDAEQLDGSSLRQ